MVIMVIMIGKAIVIETVRIITAVVARISIVAVVIRVIEVVILPRHVCRKQAVTMPSTGTLKGWMEEASGLSIRHALRSGNRPT